MSHHETNFYEEGGKGLRSWLLTLDHKRIGILYLVPVLSMFLVAGILALLIRTELLAPGKTIVDAQTYNRLFTLHGALMIFSVIIPAIPATLGNFLLPIMLGAKDVAFPRLNLVSWYFYMVGTLLLGLTLVGGAMDTGWTFYAPYSILTQNTVVVVLLGLFIIGMSSIFTGLNFIVTIHRLRAPGLTWGRLPLFVWALYATSIIQVLATPVVGITLLLVALERIFHIGIFNPAIGGDPVLFQHFFWFYSHPAVYIMILPAMGVMSEVVAVHAKRPIFGYKAVAASSLAIAAISFLVWGHHMFVSGMSELAGAIFSFLTFLVAIPTAVKVFSWTATLYKGRISLRTPMVYALTFLFLFTIGGLTGVFLGSVAVNVHLHDTYFVVAHFHYTMMGGVFTGFLAGLFHWWPKITGKLYSERWGRVGAILYFLGFNLAYIPQFILGSRGMPRRYWDYLPEFQNLHVLSSIGSYVLALGLFISLGVMIHSLIAGRRSPANPWGGLTLEWETPSPPSLHNFHGPVEVKHGPYAFDKIAIDEAEEVRV